MALRMLQNGRDMHGSFICPALSCPALPCPAVSGFNPKIAESQIDAQLPVGFGKGETPSARVRVKARVSQPAGHSGR